MKNISVILIALFLTGCGVFGPKIEDNRPAPVIVTNTTQLAYTCPTPPPLDKFSARDVDWDVPSRKQLDAEMLELLTELDVPEEDLYIINQAVGDFFFHPDDEVRWTLSADDYANLSKNTQDVLAALRQFKAVVAHYKKCIADSEEAVRIANEKSTTEVSE